MVDLRQGDCIERMKEMEDNSVDLILTDPPYHLISMVKRFGKKNSKEATTKNNDGSFNRLAKGFMGKEWDGTDEQGNAIAFNKDMWEEALRVLKPGGYLMAFSGSRTYHRMAAAIEDSGFEIRNMCAWLYGSGFPKGLDVSKAIDKKLCFEREVVATQVRYNEPSGIVNVGQGERYLTERKITKPTSLVAKDYDGYRTQLKPAIEPIVIAQKGFKGTITDNVLKYGTGAFNIDKCRVGTETIKVKGGDKNTEKFFCGGFEEVNLENTGRYPSNVMLSEEIAPIIDKQSGYSYSRPNSVKGKYKDNEEGATNFHRGADTNYNDEGGASRFFLNVKLDEEDYIPFLYNAKCSRKERGDGNNHPTLKPKALLKHLAMLGLPPYDSIVLDMFSGSGSTALAIEEINKENGTNHRTILIEKEEEYCEIIKKRLGLNE